MRINLQMETTRISPNRVTVEIRDPKLTEPTVIGLAHWATARLSTGPTSILRAILLNGSWWVHVKL